MNFGDAAQARDFLVRALVYYELVYVPEHSTVVIALTPFRYLTNAYLSFSRGTS